MKVHVIMQRVFLLLHLIAFPILSRAADPLITHTIDRVVTGDVINVDYTGVNSPGPVTFTLEYHNVAGERSFEVYYYDLTGQFGCCVNSDDIAPTPAWLRIQPSSAFYPDPGAQNRTITTSITVDPTQAGPSEALISDTFGLFTLNVYNQFGALLYSYENDSHGGRPVTMWGDSTIRIRMAGFTSSGQAASRNHDLGPESCRSGCDTPVTGEPINLTNGNTYIGQNDYALPGLGGGINLTRTWNSQWMSSNPWVNPGMFGESWQSNFEKHVAQVGSTDAEIRYWKGDGASWIFKKTSNNNWTLKAPADERATLTYANGPKQYTLTHRNGYIEKFNQTGYLIQLIDRNNNITTIAYNANNKVSTVTDAAGRVLTFNYVSNRVNTISDSTGTVVTYTYASSTDHRLFSVVYADGFTLNYAYDPAQPTLIIAVTDGQGKLVESHTYDNKQRGTSSSRGDDADALTVSYSPAGGIATVMDSMQRATSYYLGTKVGNRKYLTQVYGSGCSSCGARNNKDFTYDATNGNRTSSKDPNGNITNYTYDANGNITQSSMTVNGQTQTWSSTWNSFGQPLTASTPATSVQFGYDYRGRRTTVTGWIVDFLQSVPAVVFKRCRVRRSLGKETVYTYDSKGNLLTVKTPLLFTTTFTYDSKGQLLTIKDPRNNLTTFTYYASGLVNTVKDATNKITTFPV